MIKLTHGDKCECGNTFNTDGTLIPNIKDREFYGGRVNFFKEVKCDCGKEYVLCIEKQFSVNDGFGLKIIDMVDVTEDNPLQTFIGVPRNPVEVVKEKIDTVEHKLTTILDKETKVETLKQLTMKKLQKLCKDNNVKFKVTESRLALIDKLLEANPSVVVPKET